MELKFRNSESIVKPSSLEFGEYTVFLRQNFANHERTDADGNVTPFWTYEEAKLSREEFNEYSKCLIINRQENGDANQLIIMEAIADLYEMIANLAQGGANE